MPLIAFMQSVFSSWRRVTIRSEPADANLRLQFYLFLWEVNFGSRYIAKSKRRDYKHLMQFVFDYFVDLIESRDLIQEEANFTIHVEQPREMTESTEYASATEYASDVEMVID